MSALPAGFVADPPASLPAGFVADGVPAGPEKPRPSWFASLARGALQGATMGFADEIAGGAEALFTDKSYEQARNESRANFKEAADANPLANTIGQVGGGLATAILPAGAIVKGTGFAAHALRGAGAGILSGIGSSEGGSVKEIVQDAAESGLVGGAFGGALGGGAAKLLKGAQGRVDDRLIQSITGGRATTAGKKIYQNADSVVSTAKEFGLDRVARDPKALLEATETARQQVGQRIGGIYEEADRVFLGVKAKDVAAALAATKKRYSSPVDAPMRRQIDTLIDEVKTSWGKGPRSRVPLAKVNEMATKLEQQGFASADLTATGGVKLKRDLAGAVNKALKNRMDEIEEFSGHLKDTRTAGNSKPLAESMTAADGLKELLDLNAKYKALKQIGKMVGERSGLPAASQAAGGLRNAIGNAVDVGSMAASFATGSPLPYLATKVGLPTAKAGARVADVALAKLYDAAQRGSVTAEMLEGALTAGVPRGLVERFSSSIGAAQDE